MSIRQSEDGPTLYCIDLYCECTGAERLGILGTITVADLLTTLEQHRRVVLEHYYGEQDCE